MLPILRYKGEDHPDNIFDNRVLFPEVVSQLDNQRAKSLSHVLFVDDEIYAGIAVKACLKLIGKYKVQNSISSKTSCSIVAEDQGITHDFSIPDVVTNLELFIEGRDDMSNAITYFFGNVLINPLKTTFDGVISSHTYINVLLNLPIRRKEDVEDIPLFTNSFLELGKKEIANFIVLQQQAEAELDLFILNSLK